MRRAPSFHASTVPAKSFAMMAYSVDPSRTDFRKAACSASPISARTVAAGVCSEDMGAPSEDSKEQLPFRRTKRSKCRMLLASVPGGLWRPHHHYGDKTRVLLPSLTG